MLPKLYLKSVHSLSGINLVNKGVGAAMSEPTPFVIDLEEEKKKRGILPGDLSYQLKINAMDKTELLEEMVRFNEARARVGPMTLPLMVQGRILFRALELAAYTQELKILASSYRRQLDHEIEIKLKEVKSYYWPLGPRG